MADQDANDIHVRPVLRNLPLITTDYGVVKIRDELYAVWIMANGAVGEHFEAGLISHLIESSVGRDGSQGPTRNACGAPFTKAAR